jgi:hypothetical protein
MRKFKTDVYANYTHPETGEHDTLVLDNEQVAALRSFLEENSQYIKGENDA